MALKAVDLTQTDVFDLDHDPDAGTERATKFKCRKLSSRMQARIDDMATTASQKNGGQGEAEDVEIHMNVNQLAYATVQHSLIGWENFVGERDENVPFKTRKAQLGNRTLDVPDEATMDRLDLEDIRALAEKIQTANRITADEAKKSEG